MFTPKLLNATTFGSKSDTPELRVTDKMLGVREVLIGAVTLSAAGSDPSVLSRSLLASAAVDAWDAFGALTTRGTSPQAKLSIGVVACTASALEVTAGALAAKG
ncbi:hypothetical protein F5X71_31480 [Nocardia brasiliensis]|uniref:Uncharacterized protein n=1 Tax=Nocardia brasiliensis TaxID=37326 RepID=A0A6G9XZ71_NOCBR|nr:hypothetical protein [Nocardia brasiliensis]QIS06224.1 hypothetical protein F5X71_31480 [Nocardia brasiliensis]